MFLYFYHLQSDELPASDSALWEVERVSFAHTADGTVQHVYEYQCISLHFLLLLSELFNCVFTSSHVSGQWLPGRFSTSATEFSIQARKPSSARVPVFISVRRKAWTTNYDHTIQETLLNLSSWHLYAGEKIVHTP